MKGPEHEEATLQRVLEQIAAGAVDDAVAALDALLRADPTCRQGESTAALLRGLLHLQRGDFAAGLADALAHIAMHPEDPAGWLAMGRARAGLRDFERAERAFGEALARRPGWSDAHWHRAATRAALHDLGGAVEDLDQALLHLAPHAEGTAREARICEMRAQLRLMADDHDGARGDFIRAAAVWASRGRLDQRDRLIAMARDLGLTASP
ncbi:MAG: hypothetical protein D6798_06995 [Deltaproteobacteria bacterium]|nr:MAG: hypothetical protein D6798_06995 [Deltaproteobacteria bacterium]